MCPAQQLLEQGAVAPSYQAAEIMEKKKGGTYRHTNHETVDPQCFVQQHERNA